MRTLIISDTHFGNHMPFATYDEYAINSRLRLQCTAFVEAMKFGIANKCDNVVHLGDVFDKRGVIEPEVFNLVKHIFEEYSTSFDSVSVLTGNHDITTEGPIFNTAAMLDGIGNIMVISKPTYWSKYKWLMMPFTKDDFEQAVEDHLSSKKMNKREMTLFMHQSVIGAEYGRVITKGVDPKFLRKFAIALCGHIHLPQTIGTNVHIIGSPYPLTFGDSDHHFVYIMEDGQIVKRVQLNHPSFITVKDPKKIKSDGNFYRLVTDGKTSHDQIPDGVKVVYTPEMKKIVRIRAKNDHDLLKQYCDRHEKPDFLELGMELLSKSKGAE